MKYRETVLSDYATVTIKDAAGFDLYDLEDLRFECALTEYGDLEEVVSVVIQRSNYARGFRAIETHTLTSGHFFDAIMTDLDSDSLTFEDHEEAASHSMEDAHYEAMRDREVA